MYYRAPLFKWDLYTPILELYTSIKELSNWLEKSLINWKDL